ncbi:DUF4013 domain-containing protein [bacterium]|nr:DUF4013 domain-containing protein [bacterium]
MFLNFKEAFTFMFKDEKFWQKYIIGTALNIVPLILMTFAFNKIMTLNTQNPNIQDVITALGMMGLTFMAFIPMLFSIGYSINYANKKIVFGTNELPQWGGSFKIFFIDGLKLMAGTLLVSAGGSAISALFQIIFVILALIIAALFALISKTALGIAIIVMLIIYFIMYLLFYIAFIFYIYLAMSSFFVDKKILSVFNIKRINSLRKGNIINIILIFLVSLPIMIISILLLLIAPYINCVLMIFLNFYFMLVFYNLLSQFVQIGIKKNQKTLEAKEAKENASDAP